MPKGHPPTPQARAYNIAGARTDGISRARQIAGSRRYVYDGSLAPRCLRCGFPRERHMRGLHCKDCERKAA